MPQLSDSHTAMQHYQYSFVVDPLDGTKEFIKRNGQFTVNIALLRGSHPIMGVVQVPAQVGGLLFSSASSGRISEQRTI